jgi:hypothetical protein
VHCLDRVTKSSAIFARLAKPDGHSSHFHSAFQISLARCEIETADVERERVPWINEWC